MNERFELRVGDNDDFPLEIFDRLGESRVALFCGLQRTLAVELLETLNARDRRYVEATQTRKGY